MADRTCEFCGGHIGAVAELMSGHCNVLSKKPDACTMRAIEAVVLAYHTTPGRDVHPELVKAIVQLAKRHDYLLEQGY